MSIQAALPAISIPATVPGMSIQAAVPAMSTQAAVPAMLDSAMEVVGGGPSLVKAPHSPDGAQTQQQLSVTSG